jgi:hypothetical protein
VRRLSREATDGDRLDGFAYTWECPEYSNARRRKSFVMRLWGKAETRDTARNELRHPQTLRPDGRAWLLSTSICLSLASMRATSSAIAGYTRASSSASLSRSALASYATQRRASSSSKSR